ncbi:MAG: quinolinate synthase NadA [Eubacteriales bacterium]
MAQEKTELLKEIEELRKKRRAVILSHYYQRPEIQDIADFVGDSLELSRKAAKTDAEVIVFCGVHFMAESASILSPDKIVLLPAEEAGCPMADMITSIDLERWKEKFPQAIVVCYVNTSAEVKAQSDIACTSANAVQVVNSIPPDQQILFVPDKNLGQYIASRTRRELIMWDGFCNTHDKLTKEDVLSAKSEHPEALLVVHPECRPEVISLADKVASTSGMLHFIRESSAGQFIIGTEIGLLHQCSKQCPDKECFPALKKMVCPNMKLTTLEKVRNSLINLEPRIEVETEVRKLALKSLERMLTIV